MGDDICFGLSSMAICFDFRSTNVVQLSNWNPYFYRFWCHHPLITQLRQNKRLYKILYLKGRCYDRRVGLFLLSSPTFCFLFTLLEGLCFITRFRDRVIAGILVRRCLRQFILTISCCLSWNYKKTEIKSSICTSFYKAGLHSFRFRSFSALHT